MPRPMRRYKPPEFVCRRCRQPVSVGEYGIFQHVRRIGIKDPEWHPVMEVDAA